MRAPAMLLGAAAAAAADPMALKLFDAARAPDAVCLDGSPSGYYLREGADDRHFVIWLEEGGSCYTAADCQARAETDLGSSAGWGDTYTDESNMLSANSTVNPTFSNFTHVYVPYCSGDNHWGQGTEPHSDWGVTFAGHNTLAAVVDALAIPDAADAQVVLAGNSAGGVGVWSNVDWLADQFDAAFVAGVSQGGYFWENVTHFDDWAAGLDAPVVNANWESFLGLYEAYVDYDCYSALASGDRWQCLSADSVLPFVRSPLFVATNWFEAYQLFEVLGLPYQPLDAQQTDFVAYQGAQMRQSVQQLLDADGAVGLFMPSCLDHVADLNFDFLVHIDGVSMRDAIAQWFAAVAAGSSTESARYVDTCDSPDGLPCNFGCGGLPS